MLILCHYFSRFKALMISKTESVLKQYLYTYISADILGLLASFCLKYEDYALILVTRPPSELITLIIYLALSWSFILADCFLFSEGTIISTSLVLYLIRSNMNFTATFFIGYFSESYSKKFLFPLLTIKFPILRG